MMGTWELLSHDGNFRVTFSCWELGNYFLKVPRVLTGAYKYLQTEFAK